MDAGAELSRAITRLLLDEPFFGHLLAQIPRQLGTEVPTAGVGLVGGQLRLLVNPDFFVGRIRRIGERVAVVKHEVLHVVLRHVFRVQRRDPLLWNVACDVVVNGWVRPWPLPEGAVTRETFPDLVLPADPTA
ncbi:MAG: hypothetical protein KC621_03800, partial [Myxococcales bacterium]|nr:hypothetical protein [Myxococcales bacterium]